MKRAITVSGLVVAVACMGVPSGADAHTLSKKRATRRARAEATAFEGVNEVSLGWCPKRESRHTIRCIIASYSAETDYTCDAYVHVTFVNRRSYSTRAGSWYDLECRDGNTYDL